MTFESLGLEAGLLRAVSEQGYTEPTPIQLQAIPVVLRGQDILAAAQTGTGKTAGFTLPLLQRLGERPAPTSRAVRALVLTPTRELAAQVADSVETYGRHLPFRSAVIFGGVNINPQIDKLRRGVDVLIATPGRLLDHVQRRTVDLSQVEILVLDEADRMLDMGFIHDIRRIMKLLPEKHQRQTLLFSATFSADIRQLAGQLLNNPERVEVAPPNATVDRIEQRAHPVAKDRKRELLSHLIGAGYWQQVLVFTRTKHGANRLAKQLEADGLSASAIHGNKSQAARTKALTGFKSGNIRVLVATDIAARGLDITELPHVVNYELPNVPEDYVHRIGRTGRAGKEGTAVSLVAPDEEGMLRDIERLIRREVPREVLPGYENANPGRSQPERREPRESQGRNSNRQRQPRQSQGRNSDRQSQGQGRNNDRQGQGRNSDRQSQGRNTDRPPQRGRNGQPARNAKSESGRNGNERRQPALPQQHQRPRKQDSGNRAPRAGFSALADRMFND